MPVDPDRREQPLRDIVVNALAPPNPTMQPIKHDNGCTSRTKKELYNANKA
jgi:hypothetical protein